MNLGDKHIFAMYVPNLWQKHYKVHDSLKIIESDIVHRLTKVLRAQVGEKFIFFDISYHALVELLAISKKDFSIKILTFQKNSEPEPHITFLLPLLKKEALEEAVYTLAEIGVSEIQLIITNKSRQKLLHDKEFQRLESIIISAAEQSKNYVFPKIFKPILLSDINFEQNCFKIVFDPQGESIFDLKSKILSQQKLYLLVGPEGGLTEEELTQLKKTSFESCRLTPTILRAVQAVALGAGIFKSL